MFVSMTSRIGERDEVSICFTEVLHYIYVANATALICAFAYADFHMARLMFCIRDLKMQIRVYSSDLY